MEKGRKIGGYRILIKRVQYRKLEENEVKSLFL